MAQTHEYPVQVTWSGGRNGGGTVSQIGSGLSQTISVPKEFNGPGNGTNPEELLTSAIASCFSITFGIIAEMRKLPFSNVTTDAIGYVDQPNAATFIYNKILVKPTITLDHSAGDDAIALATDLAHKADQYCIITNAVRDKVEIVVEPTIVRG